MVEQEETDEVRSHLVVCCAAMHERGMVSSTGGNASVSLGDTILVTPTGQSLARLRPEDLVEVDSEGQASSGGRPTKELPFHLAAYRARPDVKVVLHGHSAYAVAASTQLQPDPDDALPAYTAGYLARVGRLPMLPYFPSGSARLAQALAHAIDGDTKAVLLQNHGFVAVGPDLEAAYNTAEEIMEALQVYVLTGGRARPLSELLASGPQASVSSQA